MRALILAPVASSRAAQAVRCSRPRPFAAGVQAPRRVLYFHSRVAVRATAEEEEVVEESEEEIFEEEEAEEMSPEELAAWNAQQLSRLQAETGPLAEEANFSLNFLWLDKQIGVAVDQVFKKGQRSPVTEFFFWPRKDAWEELNTALQGKTWISDADRVALLNKCTEVINFWQDEATKHTVAEAREKFDDCKFVGC